MSDPFLEFKKTEIEQSIPDRFEQQAFRYPGRIAVKTRRQQWTYETLNRFANCAARAIVAERGEGEEPVGLLLEQGAPLVAAILGALKAGKIYVPIDPSYPPSRLAHMLEDVDTGLIVSDTANLSLANELAQTKRRVLNFDQLDGNLSAENLGLPLSPERLAYIFYTSGSTGRPKGVVDNQRNVLHNIMRYTNSLHIGVADRLTLLQSCSFSGSVSSLFSALLNGATVCPFNLREEGVGAVAAWLNQEGITIYHSVPTIFRGFLKGELRFPTVRVIRLEGDQASRTDVELYRRFFAPDCILVNGLGATETGISRQYFMDKTSELTGGIVPIGYPTEDMQALLLDESGQEVAPNHIGEIAVKSRYLAVGYWRNPELTRKAFVADSSNGGGRIYRTGDMGRLRPDGCLEYLGRKDFQLKIRGHRVEPAEVETALLTVRSIREAVVATRQDRIGEPRLVAYVVPATKPAPTPRGLRRTLAETLPDHMIPSTFVVLDSLPLNANGKVDRSALPAPDPTNMGRLDDLVAPRNPVEEKLAAIWAELLELKRVGVHHDFFDLGGNSLTAAQMNSRLRKTFNVELPLHSLFESPTVAELAVVIGQRLLGEVQNLSEEAAQQALAEEMSQGNE